MGLCDNVTYLHVSLLLIDYVCYCTNLYAYLFSQSIGDHNKFLARVTKTLHYGYYPKSDRTSLPATGKLIESKLYLIKTKDVF